MDLAVESALRVAIMDWVRERAEVNGGFLYRHELLTFAIGGRDLPLIDFSRGIRNPAGFSSTLSIVSAADGPYDDVESDDGLLHYAYRKGDPFTGDNRKLRAALETGRTVWGRRCSGRFTVTRTATTTPVAGGGAGAAHRAKSATST